MHALTAWWEWLLIVPAVLVLGLVALATFLAVVGGMAVLVVGTIYEGVKWARERLRAQ